MPSHDIEVLAARYMNAFTEEELDQELTRWRRAAYKAHPVDVDLPEDWDESPRETDRYEEVDLRDDADLDSRW